MKLTNYTDYALRVLIYVANKDMNNKSTITEISNAYHISRNHLVKVIHQLGKIGVIHTTQGRGGGITLAKPPNMINVGYIVRQTEDNFHLVECFNKENNNCVLTPVCGLRTVLGEALAAYLAVLDKYTIHDLITDPQTFKQLLQIE